MMKDELLRDYGSWFTNEGCYVLFGVDGFDDVGL